MGRNRKTRKKNKQNTLKKKINEKEKKKRDKGRNEISTYRSVLKRGSVNVK